jgi:hypothetical protein
MNFLFRTSGFALIYCALTLTAGAQEPSPVVAEPSAPGAVPQQPGTLASGPVDKRVFGVLPNYRTANYTADYQPISAKQKMTIAVKDSFDYPLVGIGAIYASIYHLEDSHPQFGEGIKGYARRFGTSYADQVIGNMMSEGIFPTILHEDPRYFRLGAGQGTTRYRFIYALSRVFVTRTDSGGKSFNFAEVVGNGTGALIGWSYYTDTRDAPDYFQALGTSIATDAISQVLKEFWPDIKHHYFHKHTNAAAD